MKNIRIILIAFLTGTLATLATAEILYQATFETADNTEGWRDNGQDPATVFQTFDFGGSKGSTGALAVQVGAKDWLWFGQTQSDVDTPSYNAALHAAIDTIYSGDPSMYQLSYDMLHDVDTMAAKMPTFMKFHATMNGPDGWKQTAGDEYLIVGQQVIESKGKEWITISFNMSRFPNITPGGAWIQPNIGLAADWGANSYFIIDNIRFETADAPGYEDPDAVATLWAETFDSDIGGFVAEYDGAVLTANSGKVSASVRDGWLWFGKYVLDSDMDAALNTALANPGKHQVRYEISSISPVQTPTKLNFHFAIWNVEKSQWKQKGNALPGFGTDVVLPAGGEPVTVAVPLELFATDLSATGYELFLGLDSDWGAGSTFHIDNLRIVEVDKWASWVKSGDDVDTGTWMGWLNVANGDWVWSYSLNGYIYLPESHVSESGAWTYILAN
jgi:hypothetical protein